MLHAGLEKASVFKKYDFFTLYLSTVTKASKIT